MTVPVWLWVEDDDQGRAARFSFERFAGVRATPLEMPHDEQSLTVLSERLGVAMVWLTGCDTPDAAARELMRQQQRTHASPRKPQPRTKTKSPRKKRPTKTAASGRRMVLPRIRIVSGGLPGLGRRR
ncbi:hypothetical protein [Kribbella swartbergensis]